MDPTVLPRAPSANRRDLLFLVNQGSTDKEARVYLASKGFGPSAIEYIFEYEGIHFPIYATDDTSAI